MINLKFNNFLHIANVILVLFVVSCSGGNTEQPKSTPPPTPPSNGNLTITTRLSGPIALVKMDLINSNGEKITSSGAWTVEFRNIPSGNYELIPSETNKDLNGDIILASFWKKKISIIANSTIYVDCPVESIPWNTGWIRIDAEGLSDDANVHLTMKRADSGAILIDRKPFFKYKNISVYNFPFQFDFSAEEGRTPHPVSVITNGVIGQGTTVQTSYY